MDKVQFSCKFETVARKEVLVSLFQSAGDQVEDGANDEFLMHLDAEMPDQGNEKVQEAEFIIIVDRFVKLSPFLVETMSDHLIIYFYDVNFCQLASIFGQIWPFWPPQGSPGVLEIWKKISKIPKKYIKS